MLELNLTCEVHHFMEEISEISGKKFNEVEEAFDIVGLDPQGRVAYMSPDCYFMEEEEYPEYQWLKDAIKKLFETLEVDGFYYAFF